MVGSNVVAVGSTVGAGDAATVGATTDGVAEGAGLAPAVAQPATPTASRTAATSRTEVGEWAIADSFTIRGMERRSPARTPWSRRTRRRRP